MNKMPDYTFKLILIGDMGINLIIFNSCREVILVEIVYRKKI